MWYRKCCGLHTRYFDNSLLQSINIHQTLPIVMNVIIINCLRAAYWGNQNEAHEEMKTLIIIYSQRKK